MNPTDASNGVETVLKSVKALLPIWEMIADCLAGAPAVKERKEKYLPRPNATDTSAENNARYASYLKRAIFYNVVRKTFQGLAGFLFIRKPQIELPPQLEALNVDATGDGMPLAQFAKTVVGYVISMGRAGILTDYPQTSGNVTATDKATGRIRPTLKVYAPGDIINWRVQTYGAKVKTSLVVVREKYVQEDNGFAQNEKIQYRELRLIDEKAFSRLWRGGTGAFKPEGELLALTDASGSPFDHLPFQFVGAEDNTATPDDPPLADMAELNLGHYRNSADYEEAAFICGQATPWVAGVDVNWATNVLKGTMQLGSRGVIPLPVGGSAGLLQASETNMPLMGMQEKEKQMIALGAKLIEPTQTQRTATEVDAQNTAESSALSTAADNVSTAITSSLQDAAAYEGISGEKIVFKLHSDLGLSKMTPEQRAALIKEWQAGAITWDEMREGLRQAGIATEDDFQAKETVAKDKENELLMITAATTPIDPAAGGGGNA